MLSIKGISKTFGGFCALTECNIEIGKGSITGIIGPNGAGKSTLFNIVGGLLSPSSGSVWLEDTSITTLAPHQRAKAGLVRTFQISRELGQLTVLENLLLADPGLSGDSIWPNLLLRSKVREEERRAIAKARALLSEIGLWAHANEPAQNLSGGQKKLLEICRALMLDPKLILLDEPTAGVSPAMTQTVGDTIHKLNAQGITFAIIEHDMDVIAKHCNPIYVLAEGRTLTSGTFADVTSNRDVMRAYLGRAA